MPDIVVLAKILIVGNDLTQYIKPYFNLNAKCSNQYRAGEVAVFVSHCLSCHVVPDIDMETAECLHIDIGISIFIIELYRLKIAML